MMPPILFLYSIFQQHASQVGIHRNAFDSDIGRFHLINAMDSPGMKVKGISALFNIPADGIIESILKAIGDIFFKKRLCFMGSPPVPLYHPEVTEHFHPSFSAVR